MHYFNQANSKAFKPATAKKLRHSFGFFFIVTLIEFEAILPLLKQKIKFCSAKIDQLLF
jgi:hypothetical protein